MLARPLPLQIPTAFVRIRVRGVKVCGVVQRPRRPHGCAPSRPAKRV